MGFTSDLCYEDGLPRSTVIEFFYFIDPVHLIDSFRIVGHTVLETASRVIVDITQIV